MSFDRASLEAQLKASRVIATLIINDLATERGAHAETCVSAAARMAGTVLFRTFGLPTANMSVGSTVLSDLANERGPVLLEVLQSGLEGLGLQIDKRAARNAPGDGHQPLFTITEMQEKLDQKIANIADQHGLHGEATARACALAAALLIAQTKSVLDPNISFGIAVYGFVEGTKTVPIPSHASIKSKP